MINNKFNVNDMVWYVRLEECRVVCINLCKVNIVKQKASGIYYELGLFCWKSQLIKPSDEGVISAPEDHIFYDLSDAADFVNSLKFSK
jgi:hypothetical protein